MTPKTRTCQRCGNTADVDGWPRYERNGRLSLFCVACDKQVQKERPLAREGRGNPRKRCTTCHVGHDRSEIVNGYCRPCWAERKKVYRHANPTRDQAWKQSRIDRMLTQSDGTITDGSLRRLFAVAKRCPYCGRGLRSGMKSLDHAVPLSAGGAHSMHNLIVCCVDCNTKKSTRSLADWISRCEHPDMKATSQAWLF